jgi:RNA polymerase sigma-70 factor (ECF subfamily)
MKPNPRTASARHDVFERLYERHSREVWALAYARCFNAETALDVTQETFLRLWRQFEAGEEFANVRAWLLRVARNLAEDHAKSAFQRNGTQAPAIFNGVHAPDPLPLDRLETAETLSRVREILQQLSQDDRDILALRYALDYTAAEIAQVLGIAPTAVHMRLTRARQRVQERLTAASEEYV